MTRWRFALRSVRRDLARSVLVIALIALPVAGVTVADGIVRTMTDRDVDVDRAMGTADLLVNIGRVETFIHITPMPEGSRGVPVGGRYLDGSLRIAVGDRIVRTKLDVVEVGDPLTRHLSRLVSGRLPNAFDEVLVTRPLAERLGLLDGEHLPPGARIRTEAGLEVAVTGLSENPYYLRREAIVAPQGSIIEQAMLDGSPRPAGYLVDLPDGVDAEVFARAWPTERSTVVTRESFVDKTPVSGYLLDAAGGPIALFAGLGLLGIVLTAGAAIAVGARRQVRELGLVAANGGAAKHIRRIVLAQGLVLGVLGAASGLVLGAAVTVLGTPLWQRLTGQLMEDLRFGWGELTIAAGVGVLASVAAATVPAFGAARMHPVDALAGRFRATTRRARSPLLGVLLVTVGVAGVVAAGVLGRNRVVANRESTRIEDTSPLDLALPVGAPLLGTVLAVAGLVLVIPALLAGMGRLGARLPLSGRLAVRDAVRHRRRTVAAVVAVMVTVAGSVAAAFVFTVQAADEPKTLPDNMVLAQLDPIGEYDESVDGRAQLEKAATGMTAAVPGAVAHEVVTPTAYPEQGPGAAPIFVEPQRNCSTIAAPELGVGTPALVELATGRVPDAETRSALAAGKVVVFDDCLVSANGTVRIGFNVKEAVELPAYRAERGPGTEHYNDEYLFLPEAFISAQAAADLGWGTFADFVAVTHPASADVDAIRAAADDAGVNSFVAESASDRVTSLYLVLAAVAALVALVGAGVAVGLSAAEGRSDLATLAALGAQPRRRRTFAGAQALVITMVGTVTGLVLGGCVGFAAIPVAGLSGLAVPWQHLWLTAVGVPLLATIVAVAATRSRLPMIVRRQS